MRYATVSIFRFILVLVLLVKICSLLLDELVPVEEVGDITNH